MVNEKFVDDVFDYNKCSVAFKVDGKGVLTNEYSWEGGKPYHYDLDQKWNAGDHELAEAIPGAFGFFLLALASLGEFRDLFAQ